MKKLVLIIILCLSMVILFGLPAFAEDFTFNVPVELHNIPKDITYWEIYISVSDASGKYVGVVNHYFTISGGEFSGTIPVKFNAYPDKQPGTAKTYIIILQCRKDQYSSYDMPDRPRIPG